MNRGYNKNLVFIACCFGMLLFGISLITLGAVATDLKQKFLLDGKGSGTLFSILPVGILAGSLLFGPVCDRYGYKFLLVIACLAMFAGFEGIAYAGSLAVLKICVGLFGMGGGVINGATNALVADISNKNKGADLSLLGVFFGIGALGMPLVLGILSKSHTSFQIIAATGWLAFAAAAFYLVLRFPPSKQSSGPAGIEWRKLFNPLLLLISFFLFFQSSLEAIINNWTTTYLIAQGTMIKSMALYALSFHIVGMILMRLLTGSLLRAVSHKKIIWVCLILLFSGIALMQSGTSRAIIIAGLFLSGAGLAAGFPIMLGFVGERFAGLSGTAFSFAFTVALIGNMLINYGMGFVVHAYGVQQLTTVCYGEIGMMAVLCIFIFKKI
ncbi:MAG TPA: MFS transporter [Puia sp.]|nr:MFS transporter [Puia sp.]